MKKNYLLSVVFGAMMMAPASMNAQYISEAPAGGFDFSAGMDYVVIFTPEAQVTAMGDKILSNQNLDPNMVNNQFYYWTTDWDATQFTLYDIPNDEKNSWGGDTKLNMTPLWDWGSGNFAAKAKDYDLSAITNDHILHIGFMNIGAEDATAQYQFSLEPAAKEKTEYEKYAFGGFKLQVNTGAGEMDGKFVGVGNATKTHTWYYLDIPVSTLVDEDGDFGFEYDFSKPINGNIFTCGFKGATTSTYTYGAVDPDTGMKTVDISKVGSAMAIDHVFLYKKDASGVKELKADTNNAVQAVYDLQGRRVENGQSGIYLMKTANGVKKVAVK